MNKNTLPDPVDYVSFLQPENELEKAFLRDESFLAGLSWGKPRYGHPEGQIYKHIKDVLDNIDLLGLEHPFREDLRTIAFVHDTFKYKEDKSYPRDWSKHHSIYARRFLEQYTVQQNVLTVTELHDEAYHCWCSIHLYNQEERGWQLLQKLLERLGEHIQLYYLFFKCDTKTGDKNQAPLKWFERTVSSITVKNF